MKIKDLCQMTVCLSLLIVCSKLSINIGIIALTLQTFAVAIISYLLKWKKSLIVFLAYIIMGLAGIPVFSKGGGIFYVFEPSFGYIIGFALSCFIIGLNGKNKIFYYLRGILGLLLIDIVGMIYMYFILAFHIGKSDITAIYILQIGFIPFILKDLISVIIASFIGLRLEPVFNEYGNYNKEVESINEKNVTTMWYSFFAFG